MPRVQVPQPISMSAPAARKKPSKSSPINIVLDNEDRLFYFPGDVISGKVRLTGSQAAVGSVLISCYGRAKVKILETQAKAFMAYRSRVMFFNIEKNLGQSERTQAPGGLEWSFAFTLPQTIDPALYNNHGMRQSRLFQANDNLAHPLPPRMMHFEKALYGLTGRSTWAHIEYVLEAKIKSSGSDLEVIKQFNFEPLFAPGPLQDYKLTTHEVPVSFQSGGLLSSNSGSKLFGFRDKSRSMFKSDSLPRLTIKVNFRHPTVLQPYHPLTDPFLISASFDANPKSTTVDTRHLPMVIIKSLRIALYAHTTARAQSDILPEGVLDGKVYEVVLVDDKDVNAPLHLTAADEREKIIDLGKLCKVRLTGAQVGAAKEWPLTPTFSTWNITRWYKLEWEVGLQCGDKFEKASNAKDKTLVVVAPAEPDKDMNPDRHMAPDYEGGRSSDEVMDGLFGRTATRTASAVSGIEAQANGKPKTKAELVAEEESRQRQADSTNTGSSTVRGRPNASSQDDELPRYEP